MKIKSDQDATSVSNGCYGYHVVTILQYFKPEV
jgi:hypothetical protein